MIDYVVNIGYSDVYGDFQAVNPQDFLTNIPSRMALQIVCQYSARIHTLERDSALQLTFIEEWTSRLGQGIRNSVGNYIERINNTHAGAFNFINNVSSLYLIECILEHHNDLPIQEELTEEQEENLFKAYLYFSTQWTNEQEAGSLVYKDISVPYMTITMLLPYSELFEFKDFRIQFLKAIYFFKFCETNAIFAPYLSAFLEDKGLDNWNEYLFNLASTYVALLQGGNTKSQIEFDHASQGVFTSLLGFCVETNGYSPIPDFLNLRSTPIYRIQNDELLFLNINFLVDKIYQAIIFDFADVLIARGLQYKGRAITTKPQFIGIFGDEFIEPGLFYKFMQHVFRQKGVTHFTGDQLKERFGDGAPDYMILNKCKLYVFEVKNTLFSGPVKYSFDIEAIKNELERKFVINRGGSPKGVTQLLNFVHDLENGRYNNILNENIEYIIYPIIIVTDYTFILPVLGTYVAERYSELYRVKNLQYPTQRLTMVDLDSLIKFQDLFITKKLTLNHVLNDYQVYLKEGRNDLEKSLSFHRYIHDKTNKMKYDTPVIFIKEIEGVIQNGVTN